MIFSSQTSTYVRTYLLCVDSRLHIQSAGCIPYASSSLTFTYVLLCVPKIVERVFVVVCPCVCVCVNGVSSRARWVYERKMLRVVNARRTSSAAPCGASHAHLGLHLDNDHEHDDDDDNDSAASLTTCGRDVQASS